MPNAVTGNSDLDVYSTGGQGCPLVAAATLLNWSPCWCINLSVQNATRGQGVLRVSDSTQFTPGQWVRLVMDAPAAGGIATDMTMGIVPESAEYRQGSLASLPTLLVP